MTHYQNCVGHQGSCCITPQYHAGCDCCNCTGHVTASLTGTSSIATCMKCGQAVQIYTTIIPDRTGTIQIR